MPGIHVSCVFPRPALCAATRPRADGVTNPQNVGMIIRSAVAAGIDGVLYPKRGIASMGPLVVKASAGNLFKAPIIRCDTILDALEQLQSKGYRVAALEAGAEQSLFNLDAAGSMVCVLGSETEGISQLCSP